MKKLKILGSGCPKCNKLAERTKDAADRLGIAYEMEKVTEIDKIMSYGVMMTPALVVDEELKFSGRIPMIEELMDILKQES